jgi:ABC-type uncharacterized transport system, permease component
MIRIFMKMKEQYIKTEMEYTFNFWMMLLSGILTKVLGMAVPFVIYSNVPDIAGWKRDEIFLIMSFLFIAEGICSVLFQGIWDIPGMIFNGQFDAVLSRPVSPLFQVLSYGMGLQGISSFGVGVVSLPVLLVRLDMLNVGTVFMSLFFIVCGTLLCMSVYLIGNSTAFWYDSGGRTTIPYVAASVAVCEISGSDLPEGGAAPAVVCGSVRVHLRGPGAGLKGTAPALLCSSDGSGQCRIFLPGKAGI